MKRLGTGERGGVRWSARPVPRCGASRRRPRLTFPGVAAGRAAPAPGGPDVRQRHGAGRLRRRARRAGSTTTSGSSSTSTPTATASKDRVHTDVSRPTETDTRRPEGPGDLRGQPVLRGRRATRQLGRRPRARRPAAPRASAPPFIDGRANTSPRSARSTRSTWVPRGFAVVHAESPGIGQLDRLPDLRRAERDARRDGGHRLAQRPRQGLHDPAGTTEVAGLLDNGKVGDDGHVLQRHAADRGRDDRRRGPEGDRPDLRRSPTGTTTTAPTA